MLAYFAYFYYWTGARQFVSVFAQAAYIGGPTIAGVLLLAALKLSPAARTNLALGLCSVGFSVYAAELAFTLWFSLPSVREGQHRNALGAAAAAQGQPFDSRSRAQVIRDLRQEGQDAVPSIFPAGLSSGTGGAASSMIRSQGAELLPLAGISHTLTVVCNEGGEYLVYVSDEHGFHNPPGQWQPGAVDILSVGDSFVQGWCVSSERNFVSRIRARYPVTLNLGNQGNGPLVMLATLREYGMVLKPRTVLWFYFEANDLADLMRERDNQLLRRYLTNGYSQNLLDRQIEIDAALRRYVEEQNTMLTMSRKLTTLFSNRKELADRLGGTFRFATLRSRLGLIGGTLSADYAPGPVSADRAALIGELTSLLEETLRAAQQDVESWGGRLYFVYLPSRNRYDHGQGPNPDRDAVLARAAAVGLPIIDVARAFTASADPMGYFPFRTADHYNEAGHQLVAHTVLSHLSP